MHARPGDEIVVDAVHTGDPNREGEILEVKTDNGIEHYVVRWDDGKVTIFYPGSTAHTVRLASRR